MHLPFIGMKPMDTSELANLVNKLTYVLCEIDLLDICDIPDEYEPEARDISERLLVREEKLSPEMLKDVFEKWFGKGCCSELEYAAAHEVIMRSLTDDGMSARETYRELLDKSE